MKEIWKKISDSGHEVSNSGNIRNSAGLHLKQWTLSTGYKQIQFKHKGKKYSVHRLVALAFIPNINNLPFVNHLNHNRSDNRVENLEWCTQSRNIQHAFNSGRMPSHVGSLHPRSKLDEGQVKTIKSILFSKEITKKQMADYFSVCEGTIVSIQQGINWSHV